MNMLKKNWMGLVLVLMAAVIIGLGHANKESEPEIVSVPHVNLPALNAAFPMESQSTVKDITKQIQKAKDTQAPQYHYYTTTQQTADVKAQQLAKTQKADKIIKETGAAAVEGNSDQPVIENSYYAIELERKHRVDVGAAVIDGKPYAEAKYRNRDIEYEVYYGLRNHDIGAGVSCTIAKW